jgi:hypothetical protein
MPSVATKQPGQAANPAQPANRNRTATRVGGLAVKRHFL